MGRLRAALERVFKIATAADLQAYQIDTDEDGDGDHSVIDAYHIETLLEVVTTALNDDALTRDRPTAADLRATMDAAVKLDQAMTRGER